MWVNTRKHFKTGKKEYRASSHPGIYWTEDTSDPNIIDQGTERNAKLVKYRILNPTGDYGYGYEELVR